MLYRIFAAAFAAGILAAALISVLQEVTTTQMIIMAETFELPQELYGPEGSEVDPGAEIMRSLSTLLSNSVTTIAFALMVVVALTYGERTADQVKGLMIAALGFASFGLAPSMGMPPKLPGMPVGDLEMRQVWWITTALLTLGGLLCLFAQNNIVLKLGGIVLLIAPHVWGAPMPDTLDSDVPATLAAKFAANAVAMQAILWTTLGVSAPFFFEKFKPKDS